MAIQWSDTFTEEEKTEYDEIVLTARRRLGRESHTKAVCRIAAALDIDLDQAASVLSQRRRGGALRRIAAALGIDLEEAASELGRRGGNGRVAGAGKYSKRLGRVAKTMSETGLARVAGAGKPSNSKRLRGRVASTMSEAGLAGSATLEGMARGTHVSKGSGKTPKGELTIACKDRVGELGRLKQSFGQLETKQSFEANIAGYLRQGRIPRSLISSYGKSREEFSEEEKEEFELANWMKTRRASPSMKSLKNKLEAYLEEHPDENDCVSKMLDDVRERLAKLTKTWEAKRKRN